MSFVPFITELCHRAGWPVVIALSDTVVRLPFTVDNYEVNLVVRECGVLRGQTIIEFGSLGIALPTNERERATWMKAVLIRNAGLTRARWSLEPGVNGDLELTVLANGIAETLDVHELQTTAEAVVHEYASLQSTVEQARAGQEAME